MISFYPDSKNTPLAPSRGQSHRFNLVEDNNFHQQISHFLSKFWTSCSKLKFESNKNFCAAPPLRGAKGGVVLLSRFPSLNLNNLQRI